MYSFPSDEELIALFKRIESIAVIGLSPKPDRPSHRVAKHMQEFGFEIIPVRPAVSEVLGVKAYASLLEVPFAVDLVNVFRAPKFIAELTEQCIDKKVSALWLQEGVVDIDSANRACKENILTIMDKCIYKEYVRLMK
ncbi:MAG: CoA-binding protein [Gammaproteobacteria bacterium]|nr:CoA-binding protein [Gammaproteobacteria bacterium]MBT8124635.1 CoA-binding protein [Gammaproteobacteria bacterium]